MLTNDLLRARVVRGEVKPSFIDVDDAELQELALTLIERFRDAIGKPRRYLDDELKEVLGTGTEFLLHRGLAKLLLDRCEFETASPRDPEEVRREAFLAAATLHRDGDGHGFDRDAALRIAAEKLGITPEEVTRGLFADLKDEQVLSEFKECDARWLIERYNLALVQAVLLRAESLDISIPPHPAKTMRRLFQRVKFHQLLFRVEGKPKSGYQLLLDGPLSLHRATLRYGLQMALFIPALLELDQFEVESRVQFGKGRTVRRFRFSSKTGLTPARITSKPWQPEELSFLPIQFAKLKTDWTLEEADRVIDLGGRGVLVPDHRFVHPPTGTEVFLEILGYWRRSSLDAYLKLLAKHAPKNLILAIGQGLNAGEEELDQFPGAIHLFRTTPIAREIRTLLDRFLDAKATPSLED